MLSGAVAMSRVPKIRAPQTSIPSQHSQMTSLTQAPIESGGIVNGRRNGRHFQARLSGTSGAAISYLHLLRVWFSRGSTLGSSIVTSLLAPRFPHGGGAPPPTRIVITGNGGASFGHGVRQS